MTTRKHSSSRRRLFRTIPGPFRPVAEPMERRQLLSFADGNGPVVIGLSEQVVNHRSAIVINFDGPLNASQAQQVARYQVAQLAPNGRQIVSRSGAVDPIRSVTYDAAADQVTLILARPLAAGQCYRVRVDGSAQTGIKDPAGTLIDGDNDDTAGGDFYGLLAQGRSLTFTDRAGDLANVQVRGGGTLQLWRQLNGDVVQLSVVGAVPNRTVLTGAVRPAKGSTGQVVIPALTGTAGVIDRLPAAFVTQATPVNTPAPILATAANLPYTIQVQALPLTSLPTIQSAVSAQAGGKWLLFGGRTNGLHSFNPTGDQNFAPEFQNNTIYVIDPATGQTWSEPWSTTGLPASVTSSLASTNQEFYQKGDRLYAVGGYSQDPTTQVFQTYDTLSAISVSGLIDAVTHHGAVASGVVKQIRDPRLQVTGGDMAPIGNRTYLVFGQDFQGLYNGANSDGVQIYSNEVRGFRIIDSGKSLAIADYQAQRDPVNFRRRDGNLGAVIFPDGRQGLTAYGGVFTLAVLPYRNPIVIAPNGVARLDTSFQQYFSQYDAPLVPLYDARTKAMATVSIGGIGLYRYDYATQTPILDTGVPFVSTVSAIVRRADGSTQEYITPDPLPGRYGAEASYFAAPGVPTYSNGVVNLDQLHGPTTLGYIYGGIFSKVDNTTDPAKQTTASNVVFKVTLIPN